MTADQVNALLASLQKQRNDALNVAAQTESELTVCKAALQQAHVRIEELTAPMKQDMNKDKVTPGKGTR